VKKFDENEWVKRVENSKSIAELEALVAEIPDDYNGNIIENEATLTDSASKLPPESPLNSGTSESTPPLHSN
jgi:hypothetical protein